MTGQNDNQNDRVLLGGEPIGLNEVSNERRTVRSGWKRQILVGCLLILGALTFSKQARALDLDVFEAIFSSIQSDMGSSLKSINQIRQQVQTLYQTTMWPLAAINQARGFVVNSISTYRNSMNQLFTTSYSSATLASPQQFESILHSRLSSQIPALQTSFATNFGTVPQFNLASPQDRVLMDVDDALGQQNLKTTLVADQAQDLLLQTANQMENQVALSTPGSNPYITAQAQIANLRCQAYMQKMLAAQLRQEAGRIAHDNVLVKRKSSSAVGIQSLISGSLTSH
jgi:hypothetical protein